VVATEQVLDRARASGHERAAGERLAGHRNPTTHQRYVLHGESLSAPSAVLPVLPSRAAILAKTAAASSA
jgi:hypothetical protein